MRKQFRKKSDEIGCQLGIVISECDFSAENALSYKPPSIDGHETDMEHFSRELSRIAQMIAQAT